MTLSTMLILALGIIAALAVLFILNTVSIKSYKTEISELRGQLFTSKKDHNGLIEQYNEVVAGHSKREEASRAQRADMQKALSTLQMDAWRAQSDACALEAFIQELLEGNINEADLRTLFANAYTMHEGNKDFRSHPAQRKVNVQAKLVAVEKKAQEELQVILAQLKAVQAEVNKRTQS